MEERVSITLSSSLGLFPGTKIQPYGKRTNMIPSGIETGRVRSKGCLHYVFPFLMKLVLFVSINL
jgi:hypothetical protein